ncbi:MAG: PIN domain-containing protein [Methanobrevibacter sp.]|nr:PIN domain-containing protein [Methanobrevibacter sp.]
MIFLDSSFIIGLFVENDQWHDDALKLSNYIDTKDELVISNLILSETITTINKKIGVESSEIVYNYIMDNFTIVTETKKLYPKAIKTLVKYHNLSFADSVSIEIMKLMNIYEIASFDNDFDNKEEILRLH